ncbi:MAG: SMP-30/gluconolactonase/LRE family protein [Kiritimatiellae bacterium]|nr:SMP-30/gluconolactonase/LRE family protein [Kiritimatiellia bacterium]
MKKIKFAFYALTLTLAASCMAAGLDEVIEPGTKAEKISAAFKFTEGATVNSHGEIFFTDQPNNAIHRWSAEQGVRLFMQPAGRSNGMCFTKDGSLLACADEAMELWKIAPDGSKTVLLKGYAGKELNGPNDLWPHPEGGCFFTDPFYKRPWWTHKDPPQDTEQVYFLPEGAAQPLRVTEDLKKPNGLVGTADGKTLFVADIGASQTWKYTITPEFKLTNKTLFCEMGSDGMTIDVDGRIYLTGSKGVYVFDHTGAALGVIEIPERWSANVCIGGPDKKTLFVTASTAIYSVPLKVKGTPQGK